MIRYRPQFSGPIQGYATNTIRRFYSALCMDHEFDDLLQEAYIVFIKCSRAYEKWDQVEGHVKNPRADFMALFKRALSNRFINMADKCHINVSVEELPDFDIPAPGSENVGYFSCLLSQLPAKTRYNIGKFLNGTDEQSTKAYLLLLKQFRDQPI